MVEEERFRITKGMTVVDKNERQVGNLENIFAEDPDGTTRFFNVKGRLLPVETIDGVEQNKLKLTLPEDRLREFPEHTAREMPSPEDRRKAYDVLGIPGPAGERT